MESATSKALSATPAAFTIPSSTYFTNVKESAINITSAFFPPLSARTISRLPLRVVSSIDRAVFRTFPRFVFHATGINNLVNAGNAANVAGGAAENMANAAGGVGQVLAEANDGWKAFFADIFQASTFKSYWGMIHYLTSRWAFTCFAMALILNRVSVYGASRQRIHLTWNKRFAIRLLPIMLFIPQIIQLLQAIQCQTSPDYSLFRHGDNDKYSLLDWSTDGGSLHTISSTILFRTTDEEACAAVGMSRPSPKVRARYGSFSLLWPTFLKISLSHLVESLSASLQQLPQMTEVGMSVFEHSLAYAESETVITQTLGLGLFGTKGARNTTRSNAPKAEPQATIPASGTLLALSDATSALTTPHILDRINVPVEVLVVSLLSCGNALTSHIISVFGKQRQLRLINTGFWGMCFMGSFVWGFTTTSIMVRSSEEGDPRPVSSLLHFPTVAVVGFLPHMLILLGIFVCVCIYVVALMLTAVSLGTNQSIPQPSSLKERFSIAHDNLQAAVQLRGIKIRWYEDFYTALLRVGFAALTAASEAVFLNEGRAVEMRQFTWLEEERLDEIEVSRSKDSSDSQFQIVEEYGLPPSSPGGTDKGGVWVSGYSKERKFDKKEGDVEGKDSFVYPTPRSGGIGAMQRTTRFYLLFIYIRGIMFLVGGWITFALGALLDRIGITSRPSWLRKFVGRSIKRMSHEKDNMTVNRNVLDFWLLSEDGRLLTPGKEDLDIEPEMRKRVMLDHSGAEVETVLDTKMYDWWKIGGWFGTKDESGEYQPPSNDIDDTTSVVSMSTTASITDDEWESEPEGQRTPTQTAPSWSFDTIETRESSPEFDDTPLDAATLARLLNPKDSESRAEARILAAHLSAASTGSPILTRSRYRQEQEIERARVLLVGRMPHSTDTPSVSLYNQSSPDRPTSQPRPLVSIEEAEALETLILSRRKSKLRSSTNKESFYEDSSSDNRGPPCVVCQTSPRTIIAWPCRCLCVCEDCRVSLALNNFGNCVTCRRSVGGFVRLYVP